MAKAKSQQSLDRWTKQKWRTPSGKAAGKKKLAAANAKKREATRAGKQFASHGLHKGKKR
jgi:hypothetical protein